MHNLTYFTSVFFTKVTVLYFVVVKTGDWKQPAVVIFISLLPSWLYPGRCQRSILHSSDGALCNELFIFFMRQEFLSDVTVYTQMLLVGCTSFL